MGYIVGATLLGLSGAMGIYAAQAKDSKSLLSFDAAAIEKWIGEKRALNPSSFDQPKCLRSDAFVDDVSTSCLSQQAIFFLSEVNKRRTIEQKALRRTLKATDEKRSKANARAEAAEKTLAEAQVSIVMVDELSKKLELMQSQIAQSDQTARELQETNALLIEVYKSLTDKLHQGLKDTME